MLLLDNTLIFKLLEEIRRAIITWILCSKSKSYFFMNEISNVKIVYKNVWITFKWKFEHRNELWKNNMKSNWKISYLNVNIVYENMEIKIKCNILYSNVKNHISQLLVENIVVKKQDGHFFKVKNRISKCWSRITKSYN